MVTVCWKKYCMIPVYKEGNILFYILNKIVLTGYTPKKVHRDDYLGKQQSITLHPAISKLQVYVMKWGFFWVWQPLCGNLVRDLDRDNTQWFDCPLSDDNGQWLNFADAFWLQTFNEVNLKNAYYNLHVAQRVE